MRAGTPTQPKPGARIRFDAPSLEGRLTGTLVEWESDTLVVRVDGYAAGLSLIVPVNSVTRLDVRRERRMTLEGMGVGLLAGTLTALAADPDWVDENGDCTTLPCIAYKVSPHLDTRLAVFGIAGVLLGAIAGSAEKTVKLGAGASGAAERWPRAGRRPRPGSQDQLLA